MGVGAAAAIDRAISRLSRWQGRSPALSRLEVLHERVARRCPGPSALVSIPAPAPAPTPAPSDPLLRPAIVGTDAITDRAELDALEQLRPRTRGDCIDGPRPCPWVSCSQHIALRVQSTGTILLNSGPGYRESGRGRALNPHKVSGGTAEVTRLIALAVELVTEVLPQTCTLDLADEGPHNFVQIANLLGVDKERARQVAERGMRKSRLTGILQDFSSSEREEDDE